MAVVATVEPMTTTERRRSPRHRLCLDVSIEGASSATSRGVIHELSRTGFLLEADAQLAPGESLQLALPETGKISSRVIWNCGLHYGCEFERPLSPAAVSAAMLNARPKSRKEKLPDGIVLEESSPARREPVQRPAAPRRTRVLAVVVVCLAAWAAIGAAVAYAYL